MKELRKTGLEMQLSRITFENAKVTTAEAKAFLLTASKVKIYQIASRANPWTKLSCISVKLSKPIEIRFEIDPIYKSYSPG